jgi:hypothetical protein
MYLLCRSNRYIGLLISRNGDNAMPFVPATNVVQAELLYTWDTQVVETVLHYQLAGGYDIPKMILLGAALKTAWAAGVQGSMSSAVTLNMIRLTDLTTVSSPVINYSVGLPLAGALVATPALPNSIAIVMTKRSDFRGRSYRGRIYHPGLTEADVAANQVAAVRVTALLTSYSNLINLTDSGANVHHLVIVSRKSGGAWRGSAVVTLVTSITSDGIVDSQRRRLPGRGA